MSTALPSYTSILNLAPNAHPLVPALVLMVERAHPASNPRGCRLRDAFLATGEAGPEVCLFINIGGELRGKFNSEWHLLQAHPLYVGDADSDLIPNHATVRFRVPAVCAEIAAELVDVCPRISDSPEAKQAEACEIKFGGTQPAERPNKVEPRQLTMLLVGLGMAADNVTPVGA